MDANWQLMMRKRVDISFQRIQRVKKQETLSKQQKQIALSNYLLQKDSQIDDIISFQSVYNENLITNAIILHSLVFYCSSKVERGTINIHILVRYNLQICPNLARYNNFNHSLNLCQKQLAYLNYFQSKTIIISNISQMSIEKQQTEISIAFVFIFHVLIGKQQRCNHIKSKYSIILILMINKSINQLKSRLLLIDETPAGLLQSRVGMADN